MIEQTGIEKKQHKQSPVKPKSEALTTSKPTSELSPELKAEKLLKRLAILAEVMQVEMPSDPAMDFYVSQLSHLPDRAQELMCEKAARQLDTFGKFPTLKQLLEVSGVPSPEDQENAESLMAWDALIRYVNKYVTTDGEGNKVLRDPSWHGKRTTEAEKLTDERTLQVVRMMGGWGKFAYLPTDIEQFVRKDFIEMYKLRPAIDYVKDFKALGIGFDLKKLAEGKKM